MNIVKFRLFLATVLLLTLFLTVPFVRLLLVPEAHILSVIGSTLGFLFLFLGAVWMGLTIFLMYWFVPVVDPWFDPDGHQLIKRRGDDFFYRVHRLTLYSLSVTSRRFRKRFYRDLDFNALPYNVRFPLRVYAYWLDGIVVIALVSYGTLWLTGSL